MQKLVTSLLLIAFVSCASENPADMVVMGGNIYTANPLVPQVEAIAVVSGRISKLGKEEEIKELIGDNTQVIDLKGRTMTPGFIDSHAHLIGIGLSKLDLDLNDVKSYQEMVNLVREAVGRSQPGEWILGRGWHQSKWADPPDPAIQGFPTHNLMSQVSPENPVFLAHSSGHAGLANARAMELAGVGTGFDFEGESEGEVILNPEGKPTGIFSESAQSLIKEHIPADSPKRMTQALERAIQECLSNGITSFQDAGSGQAAVDLYKSFLDQGKLKIRLWVMLDGGNEELIDKWFMSGPKIGLGNNFLTIRAIKLYADGALGSRGAWLLEQYSDRPGHYGHQVSDMEDIYQVARRALESGFQVCTHAIGDRANREVLNQYERAFRENHDAAVNHRFRIEHAQHLHHEDIARFAELQVIASMQAIHLSSDRPWAIDRLDSQRITQGAYAWRSLLDQGAIVINGTDAPVEPINPVQNFYASVARKTLKGFPEGGYESHQKMSRDQALTSYTLDAAYGAGEEDIKGSIEVGKLADFTVFSGDIMTIPEQEILETQVDITIVDGEVVYDRNKN